MTILRAVVRLAKDSAVPQDACVNVLHCTTLGDPVTVGQEWADDINQAYDLFKAKLATDIAAGALNTVTIYDLADAEPRAPKLIDPFPAGFIPSGGQPLPAQVALCVSFQADKVSGSPQARRRGRIYLGALGQSVLDATDNPAAAAVTAAAALGSSLLSQSVASLNYNWVVYSRVDNAGYTVTNGWVDTIYDTQRRRSLLNPLFPRTLF